MQFLYVHIYAVLSDELCRDYDAAVWLSGCDLWNMQGFHFAVPSEGEHLGYGVV